MSASITSSALRPALRRTLFRPRRFESTATSKATEAAKDTAGKATEAAKDTAGKASQTAKDTAGKAQDLAASAQAKASEGLSRVTATAGPAITNAAKGVSGALGRIGGRTGRLVGFVERQVPFVIYYSRVGLELGRMTFKGQSMSPPSLQAFQSYWQNMFKRFSSSASSTASAAASGNTQTLVQRYQSISRGQMIAVGVLVAECLGFFTVGEMVGRFKLIGYHGEVGGAHH